MPVRWIASIATSGALRVLLSLAVVARQVTDHSDSRRPDLAWIRLAARLARLLAMIDVRAAHLAEARTAGELMAASGTADVADALLVLLPLPGDQFLISDPNDVSALVVERRIPVTVLAV
jgi:hypothetical protein